jgi:hypothetical protein
LQKSGVFKVDNFVLPKFLVPKLRSVAQIEWKKHPYLFFYFWFKNKQVWAEKIGYKRKNSKNLNDQTYHDSQHLIHTNVSNISTGKSK